MKLNDYLKEGFPLSKTPDWVKNKFKKADDRGWGGPGRILVLDDKVLGNGSTAKNDLLNNLVRGGLSNEEANSFVKAQIEGLIAAIDKKLEGRTPSNNLERRSRPR